MNNGRKVLGISINGVVRDFNSQFDKWYRKTYINNNSLVNVDESWNVLPDSQVDELRQAELRKMSDEKIKLPVDSYDLLNHYNFDNKEQFETFINEEYPFQIYGGAEQFSRSMDFINMIQIFGAKNKLFDTVIISKEKDKAISSTFHFLSKFGCKIQRILFVGENYNKWNYCDVMIDDCPETFESKPDNKMSIKINHSYNVHSESDYSFNSVNEVYNENFLTKIFSSR